jgi:hypothetical protein
MNLHIAENTEPRTLDIIFKEAKALGMRIEYHPDTLHNVVDMEDYRESVRVMQSYTSPEAA